MLKPEEVGKWAKRKEKENLRFRSFLKIHADEETLDRQFQQLHHELFAGYDCSKCRNCCKLYYGFMPEDNLAAAAKHLGITPKQLIDFFLEHNESTGDYETKHMPCDFLMKDGSCMLGDNKPENCRDYPYTARPDRLACLHSILESVEVCPVAY